MFHSLRVIAPTAAGAVSRNKEKVKTVVSRVVKEDLRIKWG